MPRPHAARGAARAGHAARRRRPAGGAPLLAALIQAPKALHDRNHAARLRPGAQPSQKRRGMGSSMTGSTDSPFLHPDGLTDSAARDATPLSHRVESPFLNELTFESPSVEQALPEPPRPPGPNSAPQEVAARPRLRFVTRDGKPYSASQWAVHQRAAVFQGSLDADGWTGPIDAGGGHFDTGQPFRVHIDGGVCCIASGAALLIAEPGVEYGGAFVDWAAADDEDFARRSQFWKEYERARRLDAGSNPVFTFLQHDHVMRRPVKLLARHNRAVFQVQPIAIRLGPIVRYTDSRRALIWLELETPA